eukprot:tig00000681_g3107.t1
MTSVKSKGAPRMRTFREAAINRFAGGGPALRAHATTLTGCQADQATPVPAPAPPLLRTPQPRFTIFSSSSTVPDDGDDDDDDGAGSWYDAQQPRMAAKKRARHGGPPSGKKKTAPAARAGEPQPDRRLLIPWRVPAFHVRSTGTPDAEGIAEIVSQYQGYHPKVAYSDINKTTAREWISKSQFRLYYCRDHNHLLPKTGDEDYIDGVAVGGPHHKFGGNGLVVIRVGA